MASPDGAKEEEELPYGWQKMWSVTKKRHYYYDKLTKTSQWIRPKPEVPQVVASTAKASKKKLDVTSSSTSKPTVVTNKKKAEVQQFVGGQTLGSSAVPSERDRTGKQRGTNVKTNTPKLAVAKANKMSPSAAVSTGHQVVGAERAKTLAGLVHKAVKGPKSMPYSISGRDASKTPEKCTSKAAVHRKRKKTLSAGAELLRRFKSSGFTSSPAQDVSKRECQSASARIPQKTNTNSAKGDTAGRKKQKVNPSDEGTTSIAHFESTPVLYSTTPQKAISQSSKIGYVIPKLTPTARSDGTRKSAIDARISAFMSEIEGEDSSKASVSTPKSSDNDLLSGIKKHKKLWLPDEQTIAEVTEEINPKKTKKKKVPTATLR